MENSIAYKQCYVAFLDILGFSDYVKNNDFDKIHRVLQLLTVEQNASPSFLKMKYDFDFPVNIMLVSDSIILSVEKTIPHALAALTDLCAVFQTELLLNNQMLMRGGISEGDFYLDGTILFGKAYLDAVALEQKKDKNGKGGVPRIVLDSKINLKDTLYVRRDEDGFYFVDYMKMVLKNHFANLKLPKVKKAIECNINNPQIGYKYIWLKNYFNDSINKEGRMTEYLVR